MGNRGVSSISKSGATAARSTYQPDEKNVRVAEVTILVEEAGKTEDGTILLKQLLVWNYFGLSLKPQETVPRQFYMRHVKTDGTNVQLGICQSGPFGRASVTGDCSEITFTGPDSNLTMSHTDTNNNTLYLRGRKAGKTVLARDQLRNDSYFSLWIRPLEFTESGVICIIFVVQRPTLAFKYIDSDDVVKTEPFDNSNPAFKFELIPVNLPNVQFVPDNTAHN